MYKTLGNGRCLENAVAVHLENEDDGEKVKKLVNNHIADNWVNYYQNKVTLPYSETVGVGEKAHTVEKKTKEEMLKFLRSEESLLVYSNSQELLAVANLFQVKIHIFTYKGKDGSWSEIGPHPEMSSSAKFGTDWAPDVYLYLG